MLFSEMKIENVYTFSTYSAAFLGSKVTRAKLLGVVNAATARKFSPIDQIYPQVFTTLPANAVYDVESQKYCLFEQQNGGTLVMAEQWINESTLEEIVNVSLIVKIETGDAGTADKVSQALHAAGITDFSIKVQ